MTLPSFRAIAADARRRLGAAGIEAPGQEAWLLLAAASGRSRASLIALGEDLPDPAVAARFEAMLARRLAREPMAYILGRREFWSLTFEVAPGVLIPRPDSETLVEAALAEIRDRRAPLRILDLGTGSGCLLLALLSELPNARGIGVDLEPLAASMAARNARRLGLAERVLIVRGRWAQALGAPFDLVISNPPYVRAADLAGLEPEVRAFEPPGALVAGEDGLDAYRALAPQLARLVGPGGMVCLEHGHDQAAAVETILAGSGFGGSVRKRDLAGRERVLLAKRADRMTA